MSLEILEDEVKRKHVGTNGSGSGKSVHELGARELLYATVPKATKEKDENGDIIFDKEVDIDARTELPSPANTAVLEWYGNFLDKTFGKGRGNGMRVINERYKINMISKNRKGRQEFTMVATASAINSNNNESEDILKKVQTS